jgi:diguanylate cyclase (GGDEF)-like protein
MHPVPSLARLERELADARAGGDVPAVLAALLALAARLVSDPHRRGDLAGEGMALAASLGDDVARVRCRAMVAEYRSRLGNPANELPDALDTLAEAERLRDPLALAQAHHTVAHCFDAFDCNSEALHHVRQALVNYQRAGDRFGEGRMFSSMAAQYWQLGENDRARELYERAYEIFVECDDPSGAGVMLSCVADLQRDAGDAVASVATCERSMEEFERAGMPLDAYMGMTSYAESLAATGRYDLAALWAKRAAERNRLPDGTLANPSYEVSLLLVMARAAQLPCGDFEGARATLELAVELADELGALRYAAEAEGLLAEALRGTGDLSGAYDHLRRSCEFAEKVSQEKHDQRVRALRVRFEVEQAQREALHYREQTRAQAAVIAELERTKTELAERMADLQRLNAEVVQLSQTDPLTGIANRRFVSERLAEMCEATARYGSPVAVALFDVDKFKAINDRYGHGVGDAVLVTLGGLLRRHLRGADLPARLGGDEFVVLMPGARAEHAVIACQRLRAAVRDYPWDGIAAGLTVTITIGVGDGTGESDPDEVLRRADAALYAGKHAGRDTVRYIPA